MISYHSVGATGTLCFGLDPSRGSQSWPDSSIQMTREVFARLHNFPERQKVNHRKIEPQLLDMLHRAPF